MTCRYGLPEMDNPFRRKPRIPEAVAERLREILNLVFDHEISPGKAEEALHEIAAGKQPRLPKEKKSNG